MNMLKRHPAGTLQYTLLILTVLLLFLSGFIAWVVYNQQQKQKALKQIGTAKAHRETLLAVLQHPERAALQKGLEKRGHGLFAMYHLALDSVQAAVLAGAAPRERNRVLYLSDRGQTLYLGDAVELKGNVYAAENGIRSTTLGASQPPAKKDWQLYRSALVLPPLSPFVMNQLNKYRSPSSILAGAESFQNESLTHSFFEPQRMLYAPSSVRLDDCRMVGNLWLHSDTEIRVGKTAQLHDVLLSAPVIRIERGFHGNIQAFASQRLVVEAHVGLTFPSVLWVTPPAGQSENYGSLSIGSNSEIAGYVGYYQPNFSTTYVPHVEIASQTRIAGLIYCKGNLALRGTVWGTVYADALVHPYEGMLYAQHLIEGNLDATKRSAAALDFLYDATTSLKVLQWLY